MKFVITDIRIPSECVAELKRRGFSPILLPPHEKLPAPVASHTDMLIFRSGKELIASRRYLSENPKIKEALLKIKGCALSESDDDCGEEYPADAIFNAAVLGNILLAKSDTVSKDILSYAESRGLRVLHTRQGYPACTVLCIDAHHAITADAGARRPLEDSGIDILSVNDSGAIALPPYEFGFIGGTAGVFEKTVYFAGNLNSHPDSERIVSFINNIGYEAVSLAPTLPCLVDVGGLAFIDDGADEDGNDG